MLQLIRCLISQYLYQAHFVTKFSSSFSLTTSSMQWHWQWWWWWWFQFFFFLSFDLDHFVDKTVLAISICIWDAIYIQDFNNSVNIGVWIRKIIIFDSLKCTTINSIFKEQVVIFIIYWSSTVAMTCTYCITQSVIGNAVHCLQGIHSPVVSDVVLYPPLTLPEWFIEILPEVCCFIELLGVASSNDWE